MEVDQFDLARAPLWLAATGSILLVATQTLAQSQLVAPGQSSLRPPGGAATPGRLSSPPSGLSATTPAPTSHLNGQSSKVDSGGGATDAASVRLLTKSESASQASKLLVAKSQLMEQAKQSGGKTDTSIANLQTGESLKLSLLTPRHSWATLVVERPDKIDFETGSLEFDASVSKPSFLPGNPSCNFTMPIEGYYMVDVQIDMSEAQKITTWTRPLQAEDSRAKSVTQQVQGGLNHILVSLQAGKPPAYSMMHTVQLFGAGRYTFKSCEITRLK